MVNALLQGIVHLSVACEIAGKGIEDGARGFEEGPAWMAKLAVVGGGPIFRKAGKTPLYDPADLDAWAEARMSAPRKSTSA